MEGEILIQALNTIKPSSTERQLPESYKSVSILETRAPPPTPIISFISNHKSLAIASAASKRDQELTRAERQSNESVVFIKHEDNEEVFRMSQQNANHDIVSKSVSEGNNTILVEQLMFKQLQGQDL
jgi:hypothetical protein